MSNILEFPSEEIRAKREFEQAFDKAEFPSEQLRSKAKEVILPYIEKYGRMQKMDISVELPLGINQEQKIIINEQITKAVRQYASKVQTEMLGEIVKLSLELCRLQTKEGGK